MQRGGVFAFPAGDDRPVQVQLSYTGSSTYPAFSKPVDPKDLPMSAPPPAPRRPNLFKRAVHAMFKNAFKQDFDTYARQKTHFENWSSYREAVKEQVSKLCAGRTGLHDQELADVAREKKRRTEAAEKERIQDQLTAAKAKATAVEKAMSQAKAAWEPEPRIFEDENTLARYPGRTVKAETGSVYDRLYHRKVTMKSGRQVTHEGFFNIDTFGDVKPIGKDQLDLGSIHKGESGKSFDTEDFVALTLAGTAVPRIGVQGLPYTSTADTTQVEALKGLKTTKMVDGKPVEKPCFTEEEALTLAADGPSMHYVTDVMDAAPRDGSGKFAKPVVEPARQLVKEALNQYKSGDPKAQEKAQGKEKTLPQVETAGRGFSGGSLARSLSGASRLVADPEKKFKVGDLTSRFRGSPQFDELVAAAKKVAALEKDLQDRSDVVMGAYNLRRREIEAAVRELKEKNQAYQSKKLSEKGVESMDELRGKNDFERDRIAYSRKVEEFVNAFRAPREMTENDLDAMTEQDRMEFHVADELSRMQDAQDAYKMLQEIHKKHGLPAPEQKRTLPEKGGDPQKAPEQEEQEKEAGDGPILNGP